ncbi:MAG: conjugal transfer pilus assembly protein TraF [Rickettsiales bacterium]|jgi:conjugal transfer pilus assembly protein TraF
MKNNLLPIFSVLVLFLSQNSFANDRNVNYCQEYGLGWHFYCDDPKEEPEEIRKQIQTPNQENYKEKLEEIKRTLEDKKAKAVIYPTEENIKDYMSYQKMVMDRSSNFADVWRRTLWKTPKLDYTLFRPTSKMAKEAWVDNRNSDVSDTIKNINERYGIFFIFRGDCPYCHKFAPILKSFQKKYGITIMPVSMDGGKLPHWNKFRINKGQVEKMGLTTAAVPATILFDKETRKFIPVGFGVLSHSDLEERIYAITKLEVGNDF